jgi:alkylhydroperoxidase family enzyme
MENKYYTRSKISEAKFRHLVRCFALDLTATETAVMTENSLRSVNAIYLHIRGRMAEACERQSPFSGQVEIDESYFGPHRVRGKRGRGAGGKTIVFGILKRGGQVFTQEVPNCSKAALLAVKLAALVAFVRVMVEKRGLPQRADVEAFLGAGYMERQILEIILAVAVKTISNYSNHLFHTPVDAAFASRAWKD